MKFFEDTSPITDKEKKDSWELMTRARTKMLGRHVFFAQLALRLDLVPADPSWCKTAATDGLKIYYNPRFIANLEVGEVMFVFIHELGHIIYDHFFRRTTHDPKLWNIAGDYVINLMIKQDIIDTPDDSAKNRNKVGAGNATKMIREEIIRVYIDEKYDEWTTEEIYFDLLQQQENGQKPEEDGELLDVHMDHGIPNGGDGDGDGDGQGGGQPQEGLSGPPTRKMTSEEAAEFRSKMKANIINAAKNASIQGGNVPGDVQRMVNELLNPTIQWEEIIQSVIESSVKSDFTMLRPNRKASHLSAILPGMITDDMIDVCLAIDTSGSISQDMLTEFVSEVAGIMEQYSEYRIRIWQFDTQVYGYAEYNSYDGDDVRDYQIKGGGGTDFMANWEYMREHEIEPDQFIVFTDGYPYGSWGDPDYTDTVFLIHTKYGKPEAPFGITTYYDGIQNKQTV